MYTVSTTGIEEEDDEGTEDGRRGEGLFPPDDRLDAVTPEHRFLQRNLRERARARGVAREPHPAEVTAPPALRLGVPQVSGGNTGKGK